jgi:hypothetical protein
VILLYEVIRFDYMDELCAVALFALFFYAMFKSTNWDFNKAFLITLGIFFFFTCYSLWIGSNSKRGIFNDLVIQMKPYLGFFCVYHLKPVFSQSRKKLLKEVCLFFWFIFLLPLGIISIFYEKIFWTLLGHPIVYGIAVTLLSLCYLYCSKFTKWDKIVFLVLLSLGILCGRSKFYGFFTMSFFIIVFFSNIKQFKLSLRNVLVLLSMVGVMVLVAWQKIMIYFYQAVVGSEADKDLIARFALYYTMPDVLHDYFPFGSGFASYATFSSGEWYSGVYAKYGLDKVWGLSKSYHGFISDTYYPALAQFGVAGIILYISFWIYILWQGYRFYLKTNDTLSFIIVILIVGFLAIEGTTGSTFIAQGGFFVMMLLGLVLTQMQLNPQE